MSRSPRRVWIPLAVVFGLMILLVSRCDVIGRQPDTADDRASERPAELDAAATIERSPVPATDDTANGADVRCFGRLVDTAGAPIDADGTALLELCFSDQPAVVLEAEVVAGEFPLPLEHHEVLLTRSFSAWRCSFWSDQVARSEATEFAAFTMGEQREVHFVLPPARTIEVRVTNLRGAPIPGASVDCDVRSGWAHWGHGKVRTDDAGIARFILHDVAGPVGLRASKPGYVTSTVVVTGESGVQTLQLRRLLGVCVVWSERIILQELWTLNARSSMYALRPEDFASLTARHESDFLLQEGETFHWEIYGETRWQDDAEYTATYSGWFGGLLGTVTYPVQFLAAEDFEIHRLPAQILEQVEPLHEVWFDLTPAEQILAPPPERLQFQVEAADPAHDLNVPLDAPHATPRFYLSPRRMSGLRYRGFLPAGEFTILARGCDWQPRLPHKDPALLHDVRFKVAANSEISIVALTLHPGESFVRQRFVDAFGRPLDLEAVLLPEDPSLGDSMMGFMAVSGRAYLERFVRPGYYSLWIHDPVKYGSVRHSTRFAWNGQVSADGHWDVVVDLAQLGPAMRLR